MKINKDMNLKRLARCVCVTASTPAGWRVVRSMLADQYDGQDTARVTIGAWWSIQLAALAADRA